MVMPSLLLFLFHISLDAFDNELIIKTLRDIMEGKTVHIPVYDFVTHSRSVSFCNIEIYTAQIFSIKRLLVQILIIKPLSFMTVSLQEKGNGDFVPS